MTQDIQKIITILRHGNTIIQELDRRDDEIRADLKKILAHDSDEALIGPRSAISHLGEDGGTAKINNKNDLIPEVQKLERLREEAARSSQVYLATNMLTKNRVRAVQHAFENLAQNEKDIIAAAFIDLPNDESPEQFACQKLGISRRTYYRRKNKAIDRLLEAMLQAEERAERQINEHNYNHRPAQ